MNRDGATWAGLDHIATAAGLALAGVGVLAGLWRNLRSEGRFPWASVLAGSGWYRRGRHRA
ncbi:hypothetical protein V3N99_07790 [Dermatophilaceae bacterium Soc4.6]